MQEARQEADQEREGLAPASDKLEEVRDLARAAREAQQQVLELTQRLERAEREHSRLVSRDIPERMDELGIRQIGVAPKGNMPGFVVRVKTSYHANIAADWDPERRKAALDWLDENGHGALIKTQVSVDFPREMREDALRVKKFLSLEGLEPVMREAVAPPTLKSWFKEMMTSDQPVPPMDKLGAYVKRVAVIEDEEQS